MHNNLTFCKEWRCKTSLFSLTLCFQKKTKRTKHFSCLEKSPYFLIEGHNSKPGLVIGSNKLAIETVKSRCLSLFLGGQLMFLLLKINN